MADYKGSYLHRQFGNYRLVELLGYGGFAEVYLGEHIYMGTQAAVKVLTAKLTPEEIEHFRNEARTIFGLEHPNIVRVLDYGLNGNIPYIVMSYAPNGSLRKRHPRGTRVPLPTVVEYVKQIASALQYAHDHNIIHRDIKPDNILVGLRGELLIGDFGIAVISKTGRSSLQSSYNIGGTPYYMAPEAFRGKPEKASDQYSLGIMVYEWLCGQLPFTEGDSIQIGYQHNYEAVPSLYNQASGISSVVERAVIQSLTKNPKERFDNAQTFARSLETAAKKPLIGTTLIKYKGHGDAWRDIAWSPNGKYLASGNVAGEVQIWDAFTGEFIRACGEHDSLVNAIAWSPDGKMIASASADKSVQIWDIVSSKSILSLNGHTDELNDVAWSSDGCKLASASADKTVRIWNASNGELNFTYINHSSNVNAVAWSPKGDAIASGSADHIVQVWDANTGERIFSYWHSSDVLAVSWSPDGERIASSNLYSLVLVGDDEGFDERSLESLIEVWNVKTGQHLSTISNDVYGESGCINSVTWSPDENRLACGSSMGNVEIRDVNTGRYFSSFDVDLVYRSDPYTGVISVAWSPNGQMIAACSERGITSVWNVNLDRQLYFHKGHSGNVLSVTWSPDGQRIASSSEDGTVQVWDANTSQHLFSYEGHSSAVNAATWSPDGRRIASGSEDDTVQVWDSGTGQCIYSYEKHSNGVTAVSWSQNGQRLTSASQYGASMQVWSARAGQHLLSLPAGYKVRDVAWSPDGSKIASSFGEWDIGGANVVVFNATTGQRLFTYTHSNDVLAVAWSPDGSKLASGADDGTVQVWNFTTKQHLFTYQGHSGYAVNAVEWLPDGRRIASGSSDKTVQIWDATTGKHLFTYDKHLSSVNAVAWSPDGTCIASASYGVVHVWQAV